MADHSSLLLRVRRLLRRDAARPTEASRPPETTATPVAPEPTIQAPDPRELESLEAEAKHHRARLALYRARIYALKPTSDARLHELERRASGADERLATARRRSHRSSSAHPRVPTPRANVS
jgi:hypothetical protein